VSCRRCKVSWSNFAMLELPVMPAAQGSASHYAGQAAMLRQ
jgi:hypothetical protein